MRDLFIHKPAGKTISEEIHSKLVKKYGGFWQYTLRHKKTNAETGEITYSWDLPKKIVFKNDMEKCKEFMSEDVEAVIQFSTVNYSQMKPASFFFPDEKNSKNWVMGFIGCEIKNCIEDSYQAIPSTKMDYNSRSEQRIFAEFVLKGLSNPSILNVMKFLAKDSDVESVIICSGTVNTFFLKPYKEDEVKFSNLDYENDLLDKQVEAITTILAWKRYEKNPEIDLKNEIESLKKEPHRFLKVLFDKIKGSKFLEIFS